MIVAGIDPGSTTGLALWDVQRQKLLELQALKIHQAMARIRETELALVIFEDARQRTWFADKGRESLMGAGSIRRDCTIWEDFLVELGRPYIARRPAQGGTKWKQEAFARLTKWEGRTNEHTRDAALVVYGLNRPMVEGMIRDYLSLRDIARRATVG